MMRMVTYDEEQTLAVGMSLALQLQPGDVLLLRGELGAGKSVIARGIARGLGIMGPIASPTFTLMQCHQGRLPLHHFDLYRLAGDDELYEAGLIEYIGGEAIAVIEWPERCESTLPTRHLEITIAYGEEECMRIITITPKGGFREMKISCIF